MAQGKFKVKSKLPANQKQKQKGKAFTRRPNAPIQQRKSSATEQQKLKQIVSKNVNRSAETEMRSRATEGLINLSNAQKAVMKAHKVKDAALAASAASTSTSS